MKGLTRTFHPSTSRGFLRNRSLFGSSSSGHDDWIGLVVNVETKSASDKLRKYPHKFEVFKHEHHPRYVTPLGSKRADVL